MSKTPRTDANAMGSDRVSGYDRDVVFASFARELETELMASKRLVVEKCGTCKYWEHFVNTEFQRRHCKKLEGSVYVYGDTDSPIVCVDEEFCCIFWDEFVPSR